MSYTTQATLFTGPEPEPRARRLQYIPVLRCSLIRESRIGVQTKKVYTPAIVAAIVRDHLDGADREHCVVLLLDAKNALIGINTVSVGSLCESIVHAREVFKPAILAGAAAILLAHNHPSGDPSPSPQDIAVTHKIVLAGRLLGIDLLDHVIVGDQRHVSLKERGLMTPKENTT